MQETFRQLTENHIPPLEQQSSVQLCPGPDVIFTGLYTIC